MGMCQGSFPRKFVNLGGLEKLNVVNSHPVLSISTAKFPDKWKLARDTSIQRRNYWDKQLSTHIGINEFCSKILEKHVADYYMKYLNENNLIYKLQSAYRFSHSTET